MARSLNRVQLIGNLTRDPELRYTPTGTAVCSFGLATNRSWTTETGEKHEETEFHRIVAWNKLAELCSQFLVKGKKVYLEGRLSTRTWQAQDGQQRNATEIVIDDMILLDGAGGRKPEGQSEPAENHGDMPAMAPKQSAPVKPKKQQPVEEPAEDEVVPDDIPF